MELDEWIALVAREQGISPQDVWDELERVLEESGFWDRLSADAEDAGDTIDD